MDELYLVTTPDGSRCVHVLATSVSDARAKYFLRLGYPDMGQTLNIVLAPTSDAADA